MSEQEFITAVKGLSIKMDSLNQNLGTNQITPFDGDPKLFKRWIKAIEKHAFLEGVPAENVKMIAFKTSTGAVSDFIQRYFKANQRVEWDTLKAELSMRFAEITDSQHAFMLLRQVKQEKFENVQIFAERLLSIAEEAYQGAQDMRVTENQLVGFFVDGLYSDRLKIKVMRDNPATMQDAINSARAEFNLQQRFQLRTGRNYFAPATFTGEPMEVDHYRYKRGNRHNEGQRPRQFVKKTYTPKKVLAVETKRPRSEVVCWTCNKRGHYSPECPNKKRKIEAINALPAGAEEENWEELN
ncbi:uncharacterized protein LOC134281720 [Saccostrea cucullata]|uniref:uncharacterized protein LOC134281720 n=1 Tax=Saccostrea cuccullata TaxID=36930 RepID=UPI002ED50C92